MRWVQTLTWPGLDGYNSADRLTLLDPDTQLTEAFVKAHDRLKFYWILGGGHSVRGLYVLPWGGSKNFVFGTSAIDWGSGD